MTPSPLPPSASSSSSSPSSPHHSTIRITHLLPLLLSLLTLLPPTHSTVATAAPPLRCATHPWSHPPHGSQDPPPARATTLLPPDKVNDGYCDCPLDGGIDEPATGACSGAADGMWAGLPPAEEGRGIAHFACPQQPLLILPLSRVRDGICDCCDGADEADSGGVVSTCIDVCEEVLAEERAMRAKVRKDYEVGSVARDESLRAYDLWKRGVEDKLTRLTDGDMGEVDARRSRVGEELYQVKVRWGEEWSKGVKAVLNSRELRAVVAEEDAGGEPLLNVQQLSAILLSLCQLSGEISSQYLSNGRCLPLERAAVDLGILWEYNPDETASPSSSSSSLPKLTFLADGPGGYIMVADRVLLRLEGKDYVTSGSGGRHEKEKKGKHGNGNRRQETMMDHDVDDYYGDDYEDYHDYYSYDDEDEEEDESPTDKGEDPTKNVQPEQSNPNAENESNLSPEETMVKSLLDAIPLAQDRKLFKRKAKSLLQYAPPEDTENNHEHDEETVKDDGKPENDGSEASTSSSSAPSSDDGIKHNIDPMAIQMVKSTLSKRLSSISHGETSAESAARFVASLAEHHNHTPSATATITPIAGTSHIRQLQDLILLVIYHGKISAADVAELIYAISPDLTAGNVHEYEGRSCLSPVAATRMCPPRTIPLERGDQRTFFPPSFLVEAANRRCREREDDGAMTSAGTCASAEDTPSVANGFPTTVPDGYFHYYEPKQRKDASDVDVDIDPFHTLFAPLDDLHAIPDDIRDLQTQKQKIESEKKSLEKAIQTLQSEREQSTRYGYEGELYSLRDTCHSVESGKYEYEVCIFGQATQRDIGQSHGGTHLGNWESYSIDEETRQRTLKWGRGTKCWNGPVRSAEVEVTCGAETRLLTADEPETCRYVFRMESPIGCDEKYKSRNLI